MEKLKRSFITKAVSNFKLGSTLNNTYIPKAGDVAVFEVKKIGKHSKLQVVGGGLRHIFKGDHILATFGNRYATGQFEGYVPSTIQSEYHILGQGGAVGIMSSMHSKWTKVGVTSLKLIGYALDEKNEVINTKYYNESPLKINLKPIKSYKTILSVGSSMDSGKTTTAGYLAKGLTRAKNRVAYIKLTGTVYSKDKEFVEDCGADTVLDFSDCGFPSTYMCSIEELLELYTNLLSRVERKQPDYVIIEIADGLLQRETDMLLRHQSFMNTIDHIVFSSGDSMSVPFALQFLKEINHPPIAISGLCTASPLFRREISALSNIPVFSLSDLLDEQQLYKVLYPKLRLASVG